MIKLYERVFDDLHIRRSWHQYTIFSILFYESELNIFVNGTVNICKWNTEHTIKCISYPLRESDCTFK